MSVVKVALLSILLASWGLTNISPVLAATSDDAIDTNRPSFMFSPIVVPKGSLQLENGTLFSGLRRGHWAYDIPETQVRLGVTPTTELQLSVPNYNLRRQANLGKIAGSQYVSAAGDLSEIGFKQQLGKPGRFNASIVADVTVPTGSSRLSAGGTQAAFRLPYSFALNSNWALCGMQSLLILNKGHNLQWQPDVLICRNIGSRAACFMEYGGFFTQHQPAVNILHFGGVYKVTRRQQIDAQFGFGTNSSAPSAFVGVGYSLRVDGLF